MRRFSLTVIAVAAVLASLNPAFAQRTQKKRGDNPRSRLRAAFSRGPAVGSKLPDIAAYDAAGKPFRLSSLKGSHTVLVFGCLT